MKSFIFLIFLVSVNLAASQLVLNVTITGAVPATRPYITSVQIAPDVILQYGGQYSKAGEANLFNVTAKTITPITFVGGPAAYAHAMVYDNDKTVYLFGGFQNGYRAAGVWSCNLVTVRCAIVTPVTSTVPANRTLSAAVYYKNSIVIFGGGMGSASPFGDVWTFNLLSKSWSLTTPSGTTNGPSPRVAASGVLARDGNTFVIVGGQIGAAPSGTYYADIFAYSLSESKWIPFSTDKATVSHASAAAIVDDRNLLYVYGGNKVGGGASDVVDVFDIDANRWIGNFSGGLASSTLMYGYVNHNDFVLYNVGDNYFSVFSAGAVTPATDVTRPTYDTEPSTFESTGAVTETTGSATESTGAVTETTGAVTDTNTANPNPTTETAETTGNPTDNTSATTGDVTDTSAPTTTSSSDTTGTSDDNDSSAVKAVMNSFVVMATVLYMCM